MTTKKIAVLGAGHSGYGMAADLTLAGHEIHLYEGIYKENLDPIIKRGGIELTGISRNGFAKVNRVTTDIAEAIDGALLIMVVTTSQGHEAVAELLAPHLKDGQTIILLPGNFGSVLFASKLREKGIDKDIKIAEANSFVYACRRIIGEARVHISRFIPLCVAAFPASDTISVLDNIKELYPDHVSPAKNVLEVALNNPNHFHLPIHILNAAYIENSPGPFYPYTQGISPAVFTIMEAVWQEKGAVLEKLGLVEHVSFQSRRNYFNSLVPEQDTVTGPSDMQHREITEDCPNVVVPLVSIGKMIGVATPISSALMTLTSEINRTDYYTQGRNVEYLGISGLNVEQLNAFFDKGI
ncbi:NAD/NADP octopine/nopaline dehydrogenase family protein [Chloroflexota bacterium]